MASFGSLKKGYEDGDSIACEKCGKTTRVKWFPNRKLVVVSLDEREELALRCQSCGFITCNECAHPNGSIFPVCPNCKREWGPYYFLKDDSENPEENSEEFNIPTDQPAQNLSWEQELRMDLPPVAEANTESTTDKDSDHPRRFQRLRGSPWMLLIFLLIGIVGTGLILLLLRLPALSSVLQGINKDTPTPMSISVETDTTDTPELSNNQTISVNGFVIIPNGLEECEKADDGFDWCPLVIEQDDGKTSTIWTRQGNVANSLSSNLQLLDNDGTRIPGHSEVAVNAVASCIELNPCRLEVQKIILVAAATNTPTPTQANTPTLTPTPQPTATKGPSPTITPTESLCKNASDITLDDVDKELCVQGVVSELFEQSSGVTILFDKEPGSFVFISYGPSVDFAKEGVCVIGIGPVQRLGNRPVIVIQYARPLEVCP